MNAEDAMFRSYEVSSVNAIVWSLRSWPVFYMHEWRRPSCSVGIGLAIALDELTKYFTDTQHTR